jgi:SAM-dependent methyltransferase
LRPAIEAYRAGRNVTQTLRTLLREDRNTAEIVEIAYDLQAGSYIEAVHEGREYWRAYTAELARLLAPHIAPGDRVLEAGTGEMTTLTGVANAAFASAARLYACDISWSRIVRGRQFVAEEMAPDLAGKLQSFVGDLLKLPLRDKSIDVVWTSHAIEPNGGRERTALAELFRIARRRVVLFEPSYENNSAEGRARMDSLGYIRGLPEAIAALGGRLESVAPIAAVSNPLNPTYAYVVSPPPGKEQPGEWACPATGLPMEQRSDCFWSASSKLAYPIIGGVPVLREEAAILATAFD